MKYLLYLIFIAVSINFMNAQNPRNLDSIVNLNLPSLSYLSLNTSNLVSRKFNPDFSNVNVNRNYRDIKEGNFVISEDAFKYYDQFDYEVFKYTPEDALRRILPNYDLMSAPLPPPTYYQVD